MTSPWNTVHNPLGLSRDTGLVTLVQGRTFSLSGRSGDMISEPQGLFVLDNRVLSRWAVTIDGEQLESLAVSTTEPYEGVFAGRGRAGEGQADGSVVVRRRRSISMGMREKIEVRNYGTGTAALAIGLHADVDFAGLFDVKEGRLGDLARPSADRDESTLRFRGRTANGAIERDRETVIRFSETAQTGVGWAGWKAEIEPGGVWELELNVEVWIDGAIVRGTSSTADAVPAPGSRMNEWRAAMPYVSTDLYGLGRAIDQAGEDLGALRIFDSEYPDLPVVAAGAPWFMTLFGRDSLLTAWMSLPTGPELTLGVLATLARLQGAEECAETEEEPGRILHEIRFGGATSDALGAGEAYFGTVDATPLWVMLLAEAWRWGADPQTIQTLLPHADRAMAWLADYGDRDGDGFVEYHRANPEGLANQGWKDSWDGVLFGDGALAQSPIALAEAQAYAYGAHIARADLADGFDDTATAARHRHLAAELKQAFHEAFWLEERGWYALALDHDKRPVDALASNLGHCLWTGIVHEDHSAEIAGHLVSNAMFSGFGVRTLATSMAAYNPVSYHNGSVWPHDTSIAVAGLARYGHHEEARTIIDGLLAVTQANGGRLPELFAGFDRTDVDVPAVYPASCVPQAWAAASPLLLLRVLLGMEPDSPNGRLTLAPRLPAGVQELRVDRLWACGRRLDIVTDGAAVTTSGADGLEIIRR